MARVVVVEALEGRRLFTAVMSPGAAASMPLPRVGTLAAGSPILEFQISPNRVVAGEPFSVRVQVRGLDDSTDNFDPLISLSLEGVPATITIGGTTQRTLFGTTVDFEGITLTKAGQFNLIASGTGFLQGRSDTITVVPAAPASVVVSSRPARVIVNEPFMAAAQVTDAFGNPVSGVNVTLDVSSAPLGADLNGNTSATTDSDGEAEFTGLSLPIAGSYSLIAGIAALTSAPSDLIDVRARADSLRFLSLAPNDIRVAFIRAGVLAPTVSDPIALSLIEAPVGVSLGNATTVQAIAGVSSFQPNLTTPGRYRFRATDGVTTIDSDVLLIGEDGGGAVVPPSGTGPFLVFSNPPETINAGSRQTVQVEAVDQNGTVLPTARGTIRLTLANGTRVQGTPSARLKNGVAIFSSVMVRQAGTQSLLATGSGLTAATSTTFTVTASTPKRLKVLQIPASVTAGQPFSATLRTEDRFGNRIAGALVRVLALGTELAQVATGDEDTVLAGLVLTNPGRVILQIQSGGITVTRRLRVLA